MRWEVVALLVTLVTGFFAGWVVNGWRKDAKIEQVRLEYTQAYTKSLEAGRATEKALSGRSEQIRKDANAEIAEIRRRAAADIDRMRQRQSRADLSSNPTACAGSTGKELASGDAEFLTRYAADAATVNNNLQACIKAYESVRQALESPPLTHK